MLLYEEVNLLILDEPTNHLDIDSIEALEEALDDFEGTILFISHDRYFINKVCSRIVAIEDNCFKKYDGNYDFYKNKKNEASPVLVQLQTNKKPKIIKDTAVVEKKETNIDLSELENSIKALEDELLEIDRNMTEQGSNYEELDKLYFHREELNKKLDKILEVWLKLNSLC